MKIPLVAGVLVMAAQVGANNFVSSEIVIQALLAAIAATGLFIARETQRHSLYLFGVRGDDKDQGMAGEISELKKWKATLVRELDELKEEIRSLREENAAFLREVRQHSRRGGPETPRQGNNPPHRKRGAS